jgi:hypothetical protein
MKTKIFFICMFACTLASHAQVGQWQTYERLIQEGEPLPPHDIVYVQAPLTDYYTDTVSIHHTSMPNSYIAYFGLNYTSNKVETLFGNWDTSYEGMDHCGSVFNTYWFDNNGVIVEVSEYYGLTLFHSETPRYFVKIGGMTLKVGDRLSDIHLPPGVINETSGNDSLANSSIVARIQLDGYDIRFSISGEEDIITSFGVIIDDGSM